MSLDDCDMVLQCSSIIQLHRHPRTKKETGFDDVIILLVHKSTFIIVKFYETYKRKMANCNVIETKVRYDGIQQR